MMAMASSGALGGGQGEVEKGRGRLRGLPFDSPGFFVHIDNQSGTFRGSNILEPDSNILEPQNFVFNILERNGEKKL